MEEKKTNYYCFQKEDWYGIVLEGAWRQQDGVDDCGNGWVIKAKKKYRKAMHYIFEYDAPKWLFGRKPHEE